MLRILRGAGPEGLPLLEVAERMIQRSPGMTRMMDRLEKKGLVERVRGITDRRQVRCTLSDEGAALLAHLDPIVLGFDRRMEEALGALAKVMTSSSCFKASATTFIKFRSVHHHQPSHGENMTNQTLTSSQNIESQAVPGVQQQVSSVKSLLSRLFTRIYQQGGE